MPSLLPARTRALTGLLALALLAAGCHGAASRTPAPKPPAVIGAFATAKGVGLVDDALHVRTLGTAESNGLAWSDDAHHLAWLEFTPAGDSTVAQVSLPTGQVVRTPLPSPGRLVWAGDVLYVDDSQQGLGRLSAAGQVTWLRRSDWWTEDSQEGANLAGARGTEVLATTAGDGTSGYGGPESLEVVPSDGGAPRTLVDYAAGEEGEVNNLPISHVVATRDGAIYLVTGARSDSCGMYERVDQYGGERPEALGPVGADLGMDQTRDEHYLLVITGMHTDGSRRRLYADLFALGTDCPTATSMARHTYELVGSTWRQVAPGSSTSTFAEVAFTATLGPSRLAVDGGTADYGRPGQLRVARAGRPPLVVPAVSDFVWAGAQSG